MWFVVFLCIHVPPGRPFFVCEPTTNLSTENAGMPAAVALACVIIEARVVSCNRGIDPSRQVRTRWPSSFSCRRATARFVLDLGGTRDLHPFAQRVCGGLGASRRRMLKPTSPCLPVVAVRPRGHGQAVVFLDRDEFKSMWLGNKSIYRTRMAMADGGELIVMAPGVNKFGEDPDIDSLIRQVSFYVCVSSCRRPRCVLVVRSTRLFLCVFTCCG